MISSRNHPYVSGASYGVFSFGLAILVMFSGITCNAVAGDLLRGGYTAAQSGASVPGSFTPPSVTQARQNAKDVLARTTKAIQSVTAMQSAARKIALIQGNNLGIPNPNNPTINLPSVTDGLSTNGLLPTGGLSTPLTGWTGVKSIGQTQSGNTTTVTVTQNQADAVLTWSSFNVGAKTTLDFNQSAGGAVESQWIAFNIVEGNTIAPSQILGSIKAGGQVYVINQNGIIFGGASQVNVHTLVASSLPIDMYLVNRGLLNNPDDQFLFSALSQPAGANGSPAFTPPASLLPNGADGDVIVEPGAQITSPASSANVGGRVALIGPSVTNNGTIFTPDGQTILAAGLQVGFAAHTGDASLRGLDVYVGAVTSSAYAGSASDGVVTNNGSIVVPYGDAMMVGKTVNQMGSIESTTSVSLNGQIDLLADYGALSNPPSSSAATSTAAPFLNQFTGNVTLGAGSVSEILPDIASLDTVVGSSLAIPSKVVIQGQSVHMASGSTLLAPNANVTVDAGFFTQGLGGGTFVFNSTASSSPQIYIDNGAEINVAGTTDVSESVTQNIIAVQLRGTELANDPLQRYGVFRGQTIYVDIREQGIYNGFEWVGTPLADASGYVNLIESTVAALTIGGGTVNLESGGSVVTQPGSIVNVSGGYINYQGGVVDTTQVISGGHIYDISQATPAMVYQGIFTGQFVIDHAKYGLTSTYSDPILGGSHYEAGYVYGGAGGTVTVESPSVALNGSLLGNTIAGSRQRSVAPASSTLDISFEQNQNTTTPPYSSATPPTIVIESGVTQAPADPFALNASGNPVPLRPDELAKVILSPDLTNSDGFGILSINDDGGKIEVPAGVSWTAAAGGSISLAAANITINGSITIPEGSLSFTAYDLSQYDSTYIGLGQTISLAPNPEDGNFVLGSGASLSTAGLLIDDRNGSPTVGTVPLYYVGGSISIASYNADIQTGSVINVSGGVDVGATGKPTYGAAGSISILAGKDPKLSVLGGSLTLDGFLEGYSGAAGGTLTLQDSFVQIGGMAPNIHTLDLSPEFFDQGGFAFFVIDGIGALGAQNAVYIAPGTKIDPLAENYVLAPESQSGNQVVLTPVLLSEQSRNPVSLTFNAPGVTDSVNTSARDAIGSIVEGNGASIQVDPLGSVTFKGNTVAIFGSVFAPAGTITVSGASDSSTVFTSGAGNTEPLITLELGPESVLSTAGAVIPTANNLGYNTGIVLGGGVINVSGNIAAERGALLDVSGISATLDRSPAYTNFTDPSIGSLLGAAMVPTLVESNGGTINLTGGKELFTDATFQGAAGGSAALGGSLNISSGRYYAVGQTAVPTDVYLTVTQSGLTIPASFYASGGSAIGRAIVDAHGNVIQGQGYFAADSFESSGMDSLTLNTSGGTIKFSGPVTISAHDSISVANGGVLEADSAVKLIAPYVMLGEAFKGPIATANQQIDNSFQSNGQTYYFNPTGGSGSLTVIASLIDVGNLSLQNISNLSLIADNGDIRGDGTLDVYGNILMRAGQIYPPTDVVFNIISYGGSVTFQSSGARALPLSAGGQLNVYASTIDQDGVLRAPFGTINLGWNGVGTSPYDPLTGAGYVNGAAVPIANQVTLGSKSITSVSAIDPLTGQGLIIPYGYIQNGTSWIDPSGTDITSSGVPQKIINISGNNITESRGATIDIRGGGDLYAYQFVSGAGGTEDILGSAAWSAAATYAPGDQVSYNGSTYTALVSNVGVSPITASSWAVAPQVFAIIPGYQASYAPYAPYNSAESTTSVPNAYNPGGTVLDSGYYNSKLQAGSQVYLAASDGLPAGYYTLLPARYALLPGAYIITPRSGAIPTASVTQPDGSELVSGYAVNGLDNAQTGTPLAQSFLIGSQAVLLNRAQYDSFYGNTFLALGAAQNGQTIPRLPKDGGHLIFNAIQSLSLSGNLDASTGAGGEGALVDITTSNPDGILIAGPGVTGASGQLVLDVSALNAFAAGSLLIGGVRSTAAAGTTATISTSEIQVDNQNDPLKGSDIILAATGQIILGNLQGTSGADIISTGQSAGGSDLNIAGNGASVRVSSDPSVSITRTGVTAGNTALLQIGNDSTISGGSVTLDSSQSTTIGSGVTLRGQSLAIDSGHISINLDGNAPSSGLVLSGQTLQTLASGAHSLSLLSYTSIDVYGGGSVGAVSSTGVPSLQDLALHAGAINGFDDADVTFNAKHILLDNQSDSTVTADTGADTGTLTFKGGTIALGANQTNIGQYSAVNFIATGGIMADTKSGALDVAGDLNLQAPLVTGAKAATETVTAGGAISFSPVTGGAATLSGGAGASLTFIAASIDDSGNINLPAGNLTLHATTGDLVIGGQTAGTINVGGVSQKFFDVTKYTSGGVVSLIADQGNVDINSGSQVIVSAQPGGGNAGSLSVSAAHGQFNLLGQLAATTGAGGKGGSFSLDIGDLADLQSLDTQLNTAGFNQSLSFRVRDSSSVTVDGVVDAASFQLSADQGDINILGTIDADGDTGGAVLLQASGNITLASGATISAQGKNFSSDGQGGSVSIETTGGMITIAAGSTINLSVAAAPSGAGALQDVTGTLYLQAPQVDSFGNVITVNSATAGVDLNIAHIAGAITNASSIVAAGLYVQDAATAGTVSIDSMEGGALSNASDFMNATLAANVTNRLIGGNSSISAATFNLEPSEEIENSKGSLILNNDWDLSTARYGNQTFSNAEPGFLTLRALGSITFNGSLTDGFGDGAGSVPTDGNGAPAPWLETLLPLLSNGAIVQAQRSWSYQVTSGADFTAASASQVVPLTGIDSLSQQDSVLIGQDGGTNSSSSSSDNTAIDGHYQVIRTGAGSISISSAGNVQLLNQFATVYSAGALVTDPTLGGNFNTPILYGTYNSRTGRPQNPLYPAQYTMGGGNVSIVAQGDIEHLTRNNSGQLIMDSERELPDNWLYRRGDLAASGAFDTGRSGDYESTSWWVDFSNFFEGVGALGGGNVSLTAGGSVINVDGVVPTNERTTYKTSSGDTTVSNQTNVELGGGNLLVQAGQDINGGVYYVENGSGVLSAGGSITTNSTRSPSLTILLQEAPAASDTWLATTLFLGVGSFDVTARGDLLLGSVANPFLLPGGLDNSYWYKSYFSTYGLEDSVNVTSLGGSVTLREGVALSANSYEPALEAWYENELLFSPLGTTASYYQPWLQLDETDILPFATVLSLMPASLNVAAFSGDVNIVGNITLSPSPTGTLNIEAAGSINGLQPDGEGSINGQPVTDWASSVINLSDADPSSIPGILSPFGFQSVVGKGNKEASTDSFASFLAPLSAHFTETGSTLGAASDVQSKEALHTSGVLHTGDTQPLRLYAVAGDLSGITLFSGKQTRIIVGQDITDIGLYIQNVSSSDVSVVSAGRDIIAYDPQSPLRNGVAAAGNTLDVEDAVALPGDIQISGPGTLEVLAGRNLTTGVGANNSDGTGVGITSIGNGRDPYLPFTGADIVAGGGLGGAAVGLNSSTLNFASFISSILNSADGARYFSDLAAADPGLGISSYADLEKLTTITDPANPEYETQHELQDIVALDLFYIILRDAGRDHNLLGSPGYGTYSAGLAAISSLFSSPQGSGDINLTSREIKTESGGNISIFDPVGGLTVGIDLPGTQPVDQGILTEDGGNISIFTQQSVIVGTSRIFTLRGGNEIIWSSLGDIAAGASAKTVQSAPPTRVLIDPQSGDVETDLAGLATGGGIGVLATVAGVPPGSVDLIAPSGVIDAGDAGIRATGNLNLAAVQILNASNIQAGGASSGVPTVTVAAPNFGAISAASATVGATQAAAQDQTNKQDQNQSGQDDQPSIIDVEVLGYGGGDDNSAGI